MDEENKCQSRKPREDDNHNWNSISSNFPYKLIVASFHFIHKIKNIGYNK